MPGIIQAWKTHVDTILPPAHRRPVAITLTSETRGSTILLRMSGRLDAHGAAEIEPALQELDPRGTAVLDLSGVDYLSSAGVRVFVTLFKSLNAQGGKLLFAGMQTYCREVLKVSGLEPFFLLFDTVEAAMSEAGAAADACSGACGKFVFHGGSDEPGGIGVLGQIGDVLASRITEAEVQPRTFSSTEYSIGLGALGPSVESVMPYLGEMMTIGGTMVWLPTDGNDSPDFLVPRQDSNAVVIRTGFNASLVGKFNEYVEFESASPQGATMAEIYRALFDRARERRPDYRGAIGLAMRAEVGQVLGCGVVRSPVAAHAPANGKPITDPSNYREWFEVDETPRHRDVTGLICGVGLDLDADLSVFDQPHLNAAFYVNPGNEGGNREKLHNHGVFFNPMPLGERPWSLEREIHNVVNDGQFIDMRHLFDKTTIVWAIIGVIYVQDFFAES